MLEYHGFFVITADSGEEAVAISEQNPDIDLILMDINPGSGMDGTRAAEIILKNRTSLSTDSPRRNSCLKRCTTIQSMTLLYDRLYRSENLRELSVMRYIQLPVNIKSKTAKEHGPRWNLNIDE
jgi:CheY-like chemotaxis protein